MISDATARRAACYAALVLVLAGGATRLHQAWSHRNVYLPGPMQEEGYYESAIGLLSYQTFSIGVPNSTPSAWRGPIFPVFIAMIESISPEPNPGRVRLAQAVLATFSILLVFALGWAVYSPAAGLLAAALLAFDANQAAAVTSLNIHGFYSFLILGACAGLILWIERPSARSTVLAGGFMGLTLLCRSSHFLLVPFMAGAAWLWRPLPGPRWRAPALLILGAAMALAPMAVRNRAVAGRWLLFPDAFAGAGALFGATTGTQGLKSYSMEQVLELAETAEPGIKKSPEGRLHAALFDLAVRRIVDDPLRFAGLCLERLALLARALWPPFVLGLAGLALQRRNRRLQIALILAFSFSSYCVAGGAPEHRSAAMPSLYLIAGCGGAILLGRLAGAAEPESAAATGWRGIVLRAVPFLGLLLYAVLLLALAGEARQRLWNGGAAAFEREDRALALLRRQAEGGSAPERETYSENLSRSGRHWAKAGNCAKASSRLRRSLLLNPRQPEAAGALAACLAAEPAGGEGRALAAGYRGRPRTERVEFWKAYVKQSELLGIKADLRLPSREPDLDAGTRRVVIDLWIRRADESARTGEKAAALESMAEVEALDPSDGQWIKVVNFYRRLEDGRLAAARLAALDKRRAGDLGYWLVRAELSARIGDRGTALSALSRAKRLAPLTSEQRGRVVSLYRELNEDRLAAAFLKPLLEARPRDVGLRIEHAELAARVGEPEKALQSLAAAETLAPLSPDQRRRVVKLYRGLKEPRRGDAALEPLLAQDPEDAVLWLERAGFKSQEGDREAALAALARAEKLPSFNPARRRLAVGLYKDLNAPRLGAAALAPLLESEPGDAALWIDNAELSAQAGDRKTALDSLARAEKLPPGEEEPGEQRRRLALAYQSLGEHRRALSILTELTRSFPAEGVYFSDRGLCEYLSGDARSALATLETAIRLKPAFIPAYLTLGAIHSAQGRRGEALKVYDNGLSRNPAAGRDPLRKALLDARAAAAALR